MDKLKITLFYTIQYQSMKDANLERNRGSSDQAAFFFAEVSQVATITRRWMGPIDWGSVAATI